VGTDSSCYLIEFSRDNNEQIALAFFGVLIRVRQLNKKGNAIA